MDDLYGEFITNLSRKKRKPRYSSIGLPILPREPNPKVDVLGLPIKTREQLLERKQEILDFLSSHYLYDDYQYLINEYAIGEHDISVKQVRNLDRLQKLEDKRNRGEKLTGSEWKKYSDWTLITDELLARILEVEPIELNDITSNGIPDQFKTFLLDAKSKPYILAISRSVDRFNRASSHATVFLRHVIMNNHKKLIFIEHYDPSGEQDYVNNDEMGNSVATLIDFIGNTYKSNHLRYGGFIFPTTESYQSNISSIACSRMCLLRVRERHTPIKEFVKHFYDKNGNLLIELTDEITSELLNRHKFHDKYYSDIEADIIKYKTYLDEEESKYTKHKSDFYKVMKAPGELAEIEEQLITMNEIPAS